MKPTSHYYKDALWNYLQKKETGNNYLREGLSNTSEDSYYLPVEFNQDYTPALEKENLFRRLGTVIGMPIGDGQIYAVATDGEAQLTAEGVAFDESNDTFTNMAVSSFKLATLVRISDSYIKDTNFNLSNYLKQQFARRFGRAEEKTFLTGAGETAPYGLLHPEKGAQTGVTALAAAAVTYDEITKLYFSLKPMYRRRAVWLMNDKTAMALRFLKDTTGNPLWNHTHDTIFSRPVVISPYMPDMASGTKPIAFGDLSYFWVVQRQELVVKPLWEMFILRGQIGIVANERIDGRLVQPEAVQALVMAE